MAGDTSKISELGSYANGNMSDKLPVSEEFTSGTPSTKKISLSEIRDLFDFSTAYSAPEDALNFITANQLFYVYTDATKLVVAEYLRTLTGFTQTLNSGGTPKYIYIPNILKQITIEVNSFEELRAFKPWFEGHRVALSSWVKGAGIGGGIFKGSLTSAVDDGGTVAASAGYCWKRVDIPTSLNPFIFGAQGNQPTVDNTAPLTNLLEFARNNKKTVDLRGGPWRVKGTMDFTSITDIRTDYSGRFLVNPSDFQSKFTTKYAVTFGNPDTAFRDNRHSNFSVVGLFQVVSDDRSASLNGIFIKGALFSFSSVRAVNFDGSGVYLAACWDSKIDSISVENSGNVTQHAFIISPFGDTSNCLFISRIQVEKAYHKQLSINAIRSEFHTIHAERLYVLTTDDGTANAPSGLTYQNSAITLSNSILGQVIIDAMDSTSNPVTVNATPALVLNLYATKATALALSTVIVSSTYGIYGTITNSSFGGYYNKANPVILENCRIGNSAGDAKLVVIKGKITDCVVDSFNIDYGTNGLLVVNTSIKNGIDFTVTPLSNIIFNNCTITGGVKRTGAPTNAASVPVTFIDCIIDSVTGFWQNRAVIKGGWIENVTLADRANIEFIGVKGNVFTGSTQAGSVTLDCSFKTVSKWAAPSYGTWPVGKRTQRLGFLATETTIQTGTVLEYVNTIDSGSSFKAIVTYIEPGS